MKRFGAFVLAAAFALAAGSARATILAYEGFEYKAGGLGGNGGDGEGVGFGNNTWSAFRPDVEVTETGLTYGPLITTGGAARFNGIDQRVERNLETAFVPFDGASIWISYLVQIDTDKPEVDTSTVFSVSWRAYDQWGGVDGHSGRRPHALWQWDLGQSFQSGIEIATGETVLVVQKIEWVVEPWSVMPTLDAGVMKKYLWINPDAGGIDLEGDDPDTDTADYSMELETWVMTPDWQSFDFLALSAGDGLDVTFDEVRMGTSFASVTPIPEPATLGLLAGVGALALLRRRLRGRG